MMNKIPIVDHDFPMLMPRSFSVEEILLLRYVMWFTNFSRMTFYMEMAPYCLNRMNSLLSVFTL